MLTHCRFKSPFCLDYDMKLPRTICRAKREFFIDNDDEASANVAFNIHQKIIISCHATKYLLIARSLYIKSCTRRISYVYVFNMCNSSWVFILLSSGITLFGKDWICLEFLMILIICSTTIKATLLHYGLQST